MGNLTSELMGKPNWKSSSYVLSQALASLLNKRSGGVEKEKDLFELPALPKKVSAAEILKNYIMIEGGRLEQ